MNRKDSAPRSRWGIWFVAGLVTCVLLSWLLGVGGALIAIALFVVGPILATRDERRDRRERESLLARAAARFGTALDGPPPDLHADQLAGDDIVEVFDLSTCEPLGQLSGAQLRRLVKAYQGADPETNDEVNDLSLSAEDAESLESHLDAGTMSFLRNAFLNRDELELRWVPRSSLPAVPSGVPDAGRKAGGG